MESETNENNLSLPTSQEENVNLQSDSKPVLNNIIELEEEKKINKEETITIEKKMYERYELTTDLYKLLISSSFLNNVRGKVRDRPLHVASALGSHDMVQKLLEMGHNVNVRNKTDETPLHRAVQNEHLDIVELLVENGANLDMQDNDLCFTPLHWAVYISNKEIVEYLCSMNASTYIKNIHKRTPSNMHCDSPCTTVCVNIIKEYIKKRGY